MKFVTLVSAMIFHATVFAYFPLNLDRQCSVRLEQMINSLQECGFSFEDGKCDSHLPRLFPFPLNGMLSTQISWDEYRQYLTDEGMVNFAYKVVGPKEFVTGQTGEFAYHRVLFGRCRDSKNHGLFKLTWKRLEIYELILVERPVESVAQFYALNGRVEFKAPLAFEWHQEGRERYNVETVSMPFLIDTLVPIGP